MRFPTRQFRRSLKWQPIYKVFMGRKLEAWFQLSKEEQDGFEAKLNEALEKVGAKRLLLFDTNWSSDQWAFAGAEEFPNIEAVQSTPRPFRS